MIIVLLSTVNCGAPDDLSLPQPLNQVFLLRLLLAITTNGPTLEPGTHRVSLSISSGRVTLVSAVVAPVRIAVMLPGRRNRLMAGRMPPKVQAILGIWQTVFLRGQVVDLVIARV